MIVLYLIFLSFIRVKDLDQYEIRDNNVKVKILIL